MKIMVFVFALCFNNGQQRINILLLQRVKNDLGRRAENGKRGGKMMSVYSLSTAVGKKRYKKGFDFFFLSWMNQREKRKKKRREKKRKFKDPRMGETKIKKERDDDDHHCVLAQCTTCVSGFEPYSFRRRASRPSSRPRRRF